MGKYDGINPPSAGDLIRRVQELERKVQRVNAVAQNAAATAFAAMTVPRVVNQVNEAADFTTTWTAYVQETVQVPVGYTQALVTLSGSAGATWTDDLQNVSVDPIIDGTYQNSVNSGSGGNITVADAFVSGIVDVTDRTTFDLAVWAVGSGGTLDGHGNVHMSAMVIFAR